MRDGGAHIRLVVQAGPGQVVDEQRHMRLHGLQRTARVPALGLAQFIGCQPHDLQKAELALGRVNRRQLRVLHKGHLGQQGVAAQADRAVSRHPVARLKHIASAKYVARQILHQADRPGRWLGLAIGNRQPKR